MSEVEREPVIKPHLVEVPAEETHRGEQAQIEEEYGRTPSDTEGDN